MALEVIRARGKMSSAQMNVVAALAIILVKIGYVFHYVLMLQKNS